MDASQPWRVAGSYYEVCNCEAVCPCRRAGGVKGSGPMYENCDFAISWWIPDGQIGAADPVDVADLKVVMAGRWDRTPRDPWHVTLYVDERATPAQHDALAAVFLGRAGGPPQAGFAQNIVTVHAVKRARIELDHTPARERIDMPPWLSVQTRENVGHDFTVSCGIPGHAHPGREIRAELFRYQDGPYDFELRGKCGFATVFDYAWRPAATG